MSYDALTPAQFKAAKTQFSGVVDPTVQSYIDMASRFVDKSWIESDYQDAWIAYTCHLMTLDGLGTDAASKGFKTGTAAFQEIRSGQLTLKRYAQEASGSSYVDWLNGTECGRFYAQLLRLNRAGPRVAMGGVRAGASPYAKDHLGPPYGWPGVFS